jgi:hypothetical protein
LRCESSVARQQRPTSIRRSFWRDLSSFAIPDRPAVDFLAPQGSHLKRYSYSGFVEMTNYKELPNLSPSNGHSLQRLFFTFLSSFFYTLPLSNIA